jgi:hypothetical protein
VRFDDVGGGIDFSLLDDLDLAYAMSDTKARAANLLRSSAAVRRPPMLMTRNLLYTAVTRAKKLVIHRRQGADGCRDGAEQPHQRALWRALPKDWGILWADAARDGAAGGRSFLTQFSITVRLMDYAQLETVYQSQICRDFPENDRTSLERMRQLRDLGLYECCALEQNGHPCAYAMFSSAPGCACLLLDYFAVDCRMRGQGVGTAALDAIGRYTRGARRA